MFVGVCFHVFVILCSGPNIPRTARDRYSVPMEHLQEINVNKIAFVRRYEHGVCPMPSRFRYSLLGVRFTRSCDVIDYVTNRFSIGHLLLVVHSIGTKSLFLSVFEIFDPQIPCAHTDTLYAAIDFIFCPMQCSGQTKAAVYPINGYSYRIEENSGQKILFYELELHVQPVKHNTQDFVYIRNLSTSNWCALSQVRKGNKMHTVTPFSAVITKLLISYTIFCLVLTYLETQHMQ